MGRAYRYAETEGSAPKPPELEAGQLIDRFGAAAVYGRSLTREEMREIMLAETIVNAYRQRQQAEGIAEWASSHPEMQSLLVRAMRAAHG